MSAERVLSRNKCFLINPRTYKHLLTLSLVSLALAPEIIRIREGDGLYRYIFQRKPSEVHRIAEWARNNTSEEDVFIVPIQIANHWAHFRHLSQRNVYLPWKDASGWTYAIWYAPEFLQRLSVLGFFDKNGIDEKRWRKGDWVFRKRVYYLQQNFKVEEADVLRVAKRYRVDYWITDKQTQTRFPVVYEIDTVKVVRVARNSEQQTSLARE